MELKIKQIREEKGLTQEALGKVLGLSARQYRRLENGDCTLTVKTAMALANALGLSNINELWKEDNNANL